ncbi:hypothetical protein B484DRAFT_411835, partial [Ochromonadaceae sp. CCMP2298]
MGAPTRPMTAPPPDTTARLAHAVPQSRRTAHAYTATVALRPAFASTLPTVFVDPMALMARAGIQLLALSPHTLEQQAIATGREVVKDSSSTSVIIRQSDALRTLAPAKHIARLLRDTGDMLNSYTVANFCRGAVDYFIMQQAEDGPGQRDPSWYITPAFEKQLWYAQRDSNPAIAIKVIFFTWGLSRNWQPDSLRLFHFLPVGRATVLANARFKATRDDWLEALRGMAAVYSVFYDSSYDTNLLAMVNLAHAQQSGQFYSYDYLESTVNDMFFRFFDAARNPTQP